MAKKKQPVEDALVDSLYKELSKISPDNVDNLLQLMTDQLTYMADFPRVTYSYQHPDYAKRVRPIAPYLQPIELLGWDFDIPQTLIQDLLSHPADQLVDDLENLIMNSLAAFHQQMEDEPPLQSNLIVALLLLQEVGSAKSLDIVFELLRQDLPFFETYFGDVGPDIFPLLIYRLGSDQLPKLLDFMKEPGLLPFGKTYVSVAATNVACTTPGRRLEVISWLCQTLNFFYDHIHDEAIFDGIIIDSMTLDSINIQGKEALPILEKLYATNLIMPFMAPDIKIVRKEIKKTQPTKLDELTIYQILEDLAAIYNGGYDEEEDEEDDGEEEFNPFLAMQNFMQEKEIKKSSPKSKKENTPKEMPAPKCFTLHISLRDIEPEIWRKVEVPSWLTLTEVHDMVQTVMGWSDYHLHQFKKGKNHYMPAEQVEEQAAYSSSAYIDYSDLTIGELLTRKRSKICYEYDFGDGWEHDIVLEEQRPYRVSEQPRIYLLDGANACPPEDCGGCWGYMELKEAMKHKRSQAYKEIVDWLGKPFDPTAFDKEEINDCL